MLNLYRPWEETSQTPYDWMLEHCEKYAISKEQILANAIEVKHDLEGIPEDCGVYFLIVDGEIDYVGKANQINYRIADHIRARKKENGWRLPVFYISWIIGMPELFVEYIENYYIHWLQPARNVKYSPISPITQKLLSRHAS